MHSHPGDPPPLPRDNGGKILWLVVITTLVVLSIPLAVWSYRARHYAAAKKVLTDEIERIRASGDPLTREELNAFYRLPEGEPDLTEEYLIALRGCDYDFRAAGRLPIVGLGDEEIPVPPQSWPQLEEAEAYVATYAAGLAALRALGQQPGAVRYPSDLHYRFGESSEEARDLGYKIVKACRLLGIERACRAHRRDFTKAADCVIAISATADTLRLEPSSYAQNRRASMWGIVTWCIEHTVRDPDFPAAELARIQRHLESVRWDDAYLLAALDQRVEAYELFQTRVGESGLKDLPGVNLHQILSQSQPRECGEALGFISDFVDAARRPQPETVAAWKVINDQLKAGKQIQEKTAASKDGTKPPIPNEALPFYAVYFISGGITEATAQQRSSVVVLAIERFRREHGRMPSDLEELVPDYLAAIPADPSDGKPLRFVQDSTRYAVYGIGLDRVDNFGDVQSSAHFRTDIGLFVPLAEE